MLLKADVKSLKSFDIANADVIEYKVHANTRITRKPVAQLNLPPSVNTAVTCATAKRTW